MWESQSTSRMSAAVLGSVEIAQLQPVQQTVNVLLGHSSVPTASHPQAQERSSTTTKLPFQQQRFLREYMHASTNEHSCQPAMIVSSGISCHTLARQ